MNNIYIDENLFQFTRPRGARRVVGCRVGRRVACFNSRAHGGRDRRGPQAARHGSRFNSRAHGGRDVKVFQLGFVA